MGRPERPLDPSAGPVAAFAARLRALRSTAGSPTYRELARRADFSPSVLSAATSGFTLPTLRVTLAFVEACQGDRVRWRQDWWLTARACGVVDEYDRPDTPAPGRATAPVPPSTPSSSPTGPRAGPLPTPAQLPPGARHFAGRTADYYALDVLARPGGVVHGTPVLIGGPIGVGKSVLAVHWGLQHRDQFPDGTLYQDFSDVPPDSSASGDLLLHFLRSIGIADTHIPASTAHRAALYRSVLAERRLLVLLDNVVSESQVRMLLADSSTSQVMITSRARLVGLSSVERLLLDPLPAEESLAVLASIVGADCIHAEPQAALTLAELCSHLPLALSAAAVPITVRSGSSLARTVTWLRDAHRRLPRLGTGEFDLAARLRRACEQVDGAALQVFGQVAALAEPDLDVRRLARVPGHPWHVLEDALERLVDAGLIISSVEPGRYVLPELFRLGAREHLPPVPAIGPACLPAVPRPLGLVAGAG